MTERTLREKIEALFTIKTGPWDGGYVSKKAVLALLDAHTAEQPAPDAVAEALDALGNIAAMGYSDDPAVQANIARMAVEMARSARSAYFKGHHP